MGASADAEVVTELPIIAIVSTFKSRARVGRDFVLLVARGGEQIFAAILNVGEQVFFREYRRLCVEHGVWFKGELVPGYVGRT